MTDDEAKRARAEVVDRLLERLFLIHGQRDEALRERDEARRLACGALATGGHDLLNDPYLFKDDGRIFMAHDEASARSWDCFEEPKP